MFVLISKRFSYLLKRSKLIQNDAENALEKETEDANDESSTMSDDFDDWRHMYPSIKIFIDWINFKNNHFSMIITNFNYRY